MFISRVRQSSPAIFVGTAMPLRSTQPHKYTDLHCEDFPHVEAATVGQCPRQLHSADQCTYGAVYTTAWITAAETNLRRQLSRVIHAVETFTLRESLPRGKEIFTAQVSVLMGSVD